MNPAVYVLTCNKIYVSSEIVDTAPELCQNGDISPEKRVKCSFVYVMVFMLTLDTIRG